MPRIFFDLDGTLIDAGERMYSLFQKLVPQSKLTFAEYWAFKRHKTGHKQILTQLFGYTENQFAAFEKQWMNLIETEEFLDKDTVYPGVVEMLRKLRAENELYLLTARQSIPNTHNQLKKKGLSGLFDGVFITEHKISKEEFIKKHFAPSPDDSIAGDTGKDIETGKNLGMKTIAVTNGFLAREVLQNYGPGKLADNITTGFNDD